MCTGEGVICQWLTGKRHWYNGRTENLNRPRLEGLIWYSLKKQIIAARKWNGQGNRNMFLAVVYLVLNVAIQSRFLNWVLLGSNQTSIPVSKVTNAVFKLKNLLSFISKACWWKSPTLFFVVSYFHFIQQFLQKFSLTGFKIFCPSSEINHVHSCIGWLSPL